jgi:hypothetical protein
MHSGKGGVSVICMRKFERFSVECGRRLSSAVDCRAVRFPSARTLPAHRHLAIWQTDASRELDLLMASQSSFRKSLLQAPLASIASSISTSWASSFHQSSDKTEPSETDTESS